MEQRTSESTASFVASTPSVFDHPIVYSRFSGAIDTEDSKFMRDYLSEFAMNCVQERRNIVLELTTTLDNEAQDEALGTNLTADDTMLTAGLGWVDQRIIFLS